MPTGWITLRSEASKQTGQSLSGSSVKDCRTSNEWSHTVHAYE
jgi:hypothetical protein